MPFRSVTDLEAVRQKRPRRQSFATCRLDLVELPDTSTGRLCHVDTFGNPRSGLYGTSLTANSNCVLACPWFLTKCGGTLRMEPSEDIAPDHSARLERCQQIIGYRFQDTDLLQSALTHASGAQHRLASNERMEFLGDAILGAIVCEQLFDQFPDLLEGHLTKIKSVVVSRQTCAKISAELGLEEMLIVGKGISSGKPVPSSLLADVFESLVAAIYLDGGLSAARQFVRRHIQPEIDLAASGSSDDNFKSLLQQIVQRDFGDTPTYQLLDERGPDHDKCFQVSATFADRDFPPAWGRNKKEAEQRAACNALALLNGEDPPFTGELGDIG